MPLASLCLMRLPLLLATAILASSGSPAPAQPAAAPDVPHLTPDGYDTIRIGTRADTDNGYALKDEGTFEEECRTYLSERLPAVHAMVWDGVISRLSYGPEPAPTPIRTDRGITLGNTEAAVRAAYPGIKDEPHEYLGPKGRYLTWVAPGASRGIRFETDENGRVDVIHVGEADTLTYVEGCA